MHRVIVGAPTLKSLATKIRTVLLRTVVTDPKAVAALTCVTIQRLVPGSKLYSVSSFLRKEWGAKRLTRINGYGPRGGFGYCLSIEQAERYRASGEG